MKALGVLLRTNTLVDDPTGKRLDLNLCRGRKILVLDVLENGDVNGLVEAEANQPIDIIYIPADFLHDDFFSVEAA